MRTAIAKLDEAHAARDWMALRDAIDRAGDALSATPPTDATVDALAERLTAHARHEKWQVRKAVAHATQHLRREAADAILERLAGDANAYVRDAAQRSRARRAQAASSGLLEQQHADRMRKRFEDLLATHGPQALDAALRAGKEYSELLFREANHEVVKILSAQDLALANLETVITREAFDRDAALAHTRRARERGKHLLALYRSLRDFASASTVEPTREDLRGIVSDAVGLVTDSLRKDRPALAERLDVTVTIDRALAADVHRHRLLLALRNVIQNAAEAYEGAVGAARVSVAAKKQERTVVVTVSDEGCGMSDEAVGDAFQLFTTSKATGTGIGLALVQTVIESEHAGSVRLTSTKGRGTVVTMVLPVEQRGTR